MLLDVMHKRTLFGFITVYSNYKTYKLQNSTQINNGLTHNVLLINIYTAEVFFFSSENKTKKV